jgi:hypothetical protein
MISHRQNNPIWSAFSEHFSKGVVVGDRTSSAVVAEQAVKPEPASDTKRNNDYNSGKFDAGRSGKAQFRWHLAYTLLNNPSLINGRDRERNTGDEDEAEALLNTWEGVELAVGSIVLNCSDTARNHLDL